VGLEEPASELAADGTVDSKVEAAPEGCSESIWIPGMSPGVLASIATTGNTALYERSYGESDVVSY